MKVQLKKPWKLKKPRQLSEGSIKKPWKLKKKPWQLSEGSIKKKPWK